jgi:hypothetical protein
MLNSGKKNRALRYKKNKYSNSRVVEKKWSVPKHTIIIESNHIYNNTIYVRFYVPEFNIRLYDKNSESEYFFSSTKIRIFFLATLGIRIFF